MPESRTLPSKGGCPGHRGGRNGDQNQLLQDGHKVEFLFSSRSIRKQENPVVLLEIHSLFIVS